VKDFNDVVQNQNTVADRTAHGQPDEVLRPTKSVTWDKKKLMRKQEIN
jgi:hypothetical protein